jgi:G:T-mismatch repair DNA endonuclease (very short patch repair protein)
VPKANRDYWLAKVGRNRSRDIGTREKLEAAGWRVETIWECEMKDRAALEARLAVLLKPAHPGECRAFAGTSGKKELRTLPPPAPSPAPPRS